MAESELLQTIAEVAVAFAGFASLVGILGKRTSVDHELVLGTRMRAMLLASLLVVAFALLPPILSWYGRSPGATWGVSNLAFMAAVIAYLIWLARGFAALRRQVSPRPFQRYVILPVLALVFAALVSLLSMNVFLRSPALYITALGLLLFQAGFAFTLIVFSFLPRLLERRNGSRNDEGRRAASPGA